jgi:mRNA interferase YafQ
VARTIEETRQFKRDKKRLKGSGRHDWARMIAVVSSLMHDQPLEPRLRDHALTGDYAGVRECHVEPDWLLIYDKDGPLDGGSLRLVRTGSHSELF